MSVLVDISEFVGNPVRTGIQRVVRELIANWPSSKPVCFCAYAPELDGLYELPDRTVSLACNGASTAGICEAELKLRIADSDPHIRRRPLPFEKRRVLIPEVFYERNRMTFYQRSVGASKVFPRVIVQDFAAYLSPSHFGIAPTTSNVILPYLYLVRAAEARAFTTRIVADQYSARIVRTNKMEKDVVIRLGADGLGSQRQRWASSRRTIVCVGSFDGKKNQHVLFEAYRASERLRKGLKLCFIGRRPEGWQRSIFAPIFSHDFPGVEIIVDASDADIGAALCEARATVFIGTAEGFGLPAVESLSAGIPVVAWSQLPALSGLSDAGQIRLDEITVDKTRAALEALLDDATAERLWNDAAKLDLETWAGYAEAIATWVTT